MGYDQPLLPTYSFRLSSPQDLLIFSQEFPHPLVTFDKDGSSTLFQNSILRVTATIRTKTDANGAIIELETRDPRNLTVHIPSQMLVRVVTKTNFLYRKLINNSRINHDYITWLALRLTAMDEIIEAFETNAHIRRELYPQGYTLELLKTLRYNLQIKLNTQTYFMQDDETVERLHSVFRIYETTIDTFMNLEHIEQLAKQLDWYLLQLRISLGGDQISAENYEIFLSVRTNLTRILARRYSVDHDKITLVETVLMSILAVRSRGIHAALTEWNTVKEFAGSNHY